MSNQRRPNNKVLDKGSAIVEMLRQFVKPFAKAFLDSFYLFSPRLPLGDLLEDLRRTRIGIDRRVQAAQAALLIAQANLRDTKDALENVAVTLEELKSELNSGLKRLESLREETGRYQKLAKLGEEKAQPIIQQVELALSRKSGRERWIALGLNILAGLIVFGLGLLIGTWIRR